MIQVHLDHSNYSTLFGFTVFILMHKIIYTDDLKWKLLIQFFFSIFLQVIYF